MLSRLSLADVAIAMRPWRAAWPDALTVCGVEEWGGDELTSAGSGSARIFADVVAFLIAWHCYANGRNRPSFALVSRLWLFTRLITRAYGRIHTM